MIYPASAAGPSPRIIRAARDNPRAFIQTCRITREEDESVGPLRMTDVQSAAYIAMEAHPYLLVNKYRQAKMSTLVAMWLLHQIEFAAGLVGVIIAEKDATARTLWKRIKDAYQAQPGELRLPTQAIGASGMTFVSGSEIRVLTAGSDAPAIGQSIDRLHISEYCEWENQRIANTSLFPAVIKRPKARAVIESTPGAHASVHHQMWTTALAGGDSRWHPLFLKWWLDPTCTVPAPSGFKPDNTELALMERMKGISFGHLQFRRVALAGEFFGDGRLFASKYPSDEYDGWVTTSSPAIPEVPLRKLLPGLPDPALGEAWEEPEPDAPYLITADPNSYGKTGDPSAYSLWHVWSRREIAAWSAREDPTRLADILAALGRKFNNALIAVESNSAACITALVNGGYRNVYFNDDGEKHPGWYATGAAKDRAHQRLVRALLNDELIVRSKSGLAQLLAYDGRSGHRRDGHHFDRVIAYLMAADILSGHSFRRAPPSRDVPPREKGVKVQFLLGQRAPLRRGDKRLRLERPPKLRL